MKYVSCMGEVFKISKANYKRYLTAVAGGDVNADLEQYGAKFLYAPTNVTDITADWAKCLLEMMSKRTEK